MKSNGRGSVYVRFEHPEGISYGIHEKDVIKELTGNIFYEARPTGRTFQASQVNLLVPCQPSKVIAVGLNYASHRSPNSRRASFRTARTLSFRTMPPTSTSKANSRS
jgi:2-keto-4-pentenoate hydratase/2-oxohepta-3-ene-1,7-dioic acid hydratase in catechol pathway